MLLQRRAGCRRGPWPWLQPGLRMCPRPLLRLRQWLLLCRQLPSSQQQCWQRLQAALLWLRLCLRLLCLPPHLLCLPPLLRVRQWQWLQQSLWSSLQPGS